MTEETGGRGAGKTEISQLFLRIKRQERKGGVQENNRSEHTLKGMQKEGSV